MGNKLQQYVHLRRLRMVMVDLLLSWRESMTKEVSVTSHEYDDIVGTPKRLAKLCFYHLSILVWGFD